MKLEMRWINFSLILTLALLTETVLMIHTKQKQQALITPLVYSQVLTGSISRMNTKVCHVLKNKD